MKLSRLTLDLDVLQLIVATMMMSGIDDRERRSQKRQQKTERRERTTTYIDEKHEFRSKSETGVSALVSLFGSCYSNRFMYSRGCDQLLFYVPLSKVETYTTFALPPWWWT